MNKKDILKIKDYENRSLNFIIEEMKHQFPKNKLMSMRGLPSKKIIILKSDQVFIKTKARRGERPWKRTSRAFTPYKNMKCKPMTKTQLKIFLKQLLLFARVEEKINDNHS